MNGATRLAMNKMGPAYLVLGADPRKQLGSGGIEIAGSHIKGPVPPGARVFDLRGASRHVESRNNFYWYEWTREQMGWLPTQLGNGVKIHTLGDNMSGGPAQTQPEEWIEAAMGAQEWTDNYARAHAAPPPPSA